MPESILKAQPFLDGLFFGECPRWHDGRLWYSDFFDHGVFSVTPEGSAHKEVEYEGETGGIGWMPDDRLLLVDRLARTVQRREQNGVLAAHSDLRPWATWHANDMVVATNGQAYVGNFGFDLDGLDDGTTPASAIAPTSIIRVDPDGTSAEAAADIQFPNGMVITDDGRTFVVAESLGGKLSAFDRAEDGSLSNYREWAPLPGIAPDGICLCADNTIWVANALGPECVRVAEGGEILERVQTMKNCYACMLGDEDRLTLYLVTADTSDAAKARVARNGTLEKVRTSVPGAGRP